MIRLSADAYIAKLHDTQAVRIHGRVTQLIGLTIEAEGVQAKIGELCTIYTDYKPQPIEAEVVGFKGSKVLLMPLDDLDDIGSGCTVVPNDGPMYVKVGQALLGKVLDGKGVPLDGTPLPKGLVQYSTSQHPPNPLSRPRIQEPMQVGIRAIDGLLTVGNGQRVGIFAGSGVGKSTLMGMIARNTEADVNVIALIGERGREVRDFIERDLGQQGLAKSVLVVATSDQPPLQRIKGAFTATSIAEYFRDQGKNVMLMMDSVTRFAMAQREIGLAIGEPPTTKGYTPSVFSTLPRLLERSGTSSTGSITAFYTVLVDGDDFNEPVADAVRGILDGHIVLDRALAQKGHFPAIHVGNSVSRTMSELVEPNHLRAANTFKKFLSVYESSEDLINIGAYKKGSNKEIDRAIKMYPQMESYLIQQVDEKIDQEASMKQLLERFGGEIK